MKTYNLAIIRTSRDEATHEIKATSLEEAKAKIREMAVNNHLTNELTFSRSQKEGYEIEEINE